MTYYNYFYIYEGIYITIKSRFKVGGSSRSVGSFHYVRASSRVF
jgi:hypothetical protein